MEYKANAKKMKRVISEAFIKLLDDRPFEKISVQNILTEAEINRSTFYKYFQDKYDLARQIITRLQEDFGTMLNAKNFATEAAFTEIYLYIDENKHVYRNLLKIKTPELDVFDEIINSFCKIYYETGNRGKNAMYEAQYFATFCYIPLAFHVKSETPLSKSEHTLAFHEAATTVFAQFFGIEFRALSNFIVSQKFGENSSFQ